MSFLNSGGQTCPPFFKTKNIHYKGVVLELLAPICKREKKHIHSCGFFPPEVSLSTLGGGVDRLSTEAFLPWSGLVCPLWTQGPYSSPLVLPQMWGGDAPRIDLMASQIDLVPHHHEDLCLIYPFPLMPRGVEQSSLLECFPS